MPPRTHRRRTAMALAVAFALLLAAGGCGQPNGAPPPGGPVVTPPPPGGAPPPPSPPTATRAWSDPGGWPGGALPQAGDVVTIPHGSRVLLDVDPPPLGGLMLHGDLVFDDRDLALTSDWIMVHGGLYVGSAAAPFAHRATITLAGAPTGSDVLGMDMGEKLLGVMGGVLALVGHVSGPSWTRLADDAPPGTTTLRVEDATGWEVGDRIVVTSTDFEAWSGPQGDPAARDAQVEERTVTGVDGDVLTIDAPLAYHHVGRSETIGGIVVDGRAEVARLDRRIVIQGDEASAVPGSDRFGFGGHVMAMGASRLYLHGVEFRRMGQRGLLGRYPVHWHLMGDAPAGNALVGSSVHGSFNRCVTIHGTNGLWIADTVAYDATGHCFFLEDGAETRNVLYRNLALMIRRPAPEHALLASDLHGLGPAGFWVTNPANDLVGNVAASSQGTGFWYALPTHPTGPSYDLFGGADVHPRRTPLGAFRGNVAHSNGSTGLHVDDGPTPDTSAIQVAPYRPRSVPADAGSAPVTAVFEDFVAFKHRRAGAWFRGDHTVLRGGALFDNAVGVTFASRASGADRVAFVGETSNVGTPRAWEATGEGGRALPRYWHPSYAIRGFELYDGDVWVRDARFAAFEPNAVRTASALAYLDFTAFPVSPRNAASGLTFAAGTNRVHHATRSPTTGEPADGYRSAVFRDDDGSVTGTAGAFVVPDDAFLLAAGCALRPAWNARVCPGTYASLTFDDVQGPGGLAPVTLRRADGPEHVLLGMPGAHRVFRTLLRPAYAYAATWSGTSDRLRVILQDVAPGDAMLVSLPWTGAAPYAYRDWWVDDRALLGAYPSPEALAAAPGAGYHFDGERLHLRLVVQSGRDYAQVELCRARGCP